MQFSSRVIDGAKRLHGLGLAWEPQPGHYVWDKNGVIETTSPFQARVYFILDLKHFLRRAGTIEALKRSFVWLPTWHDARDILSKLEVPDADVRRRLTAKEAIERRDELLVLYELIAEHVERAVD